jgi:hypothetical protein
MECYGSLADIKRPTKFVRKVPKQTIARGGSSAPQKISDKMALGHRF